MNRPQASIERGFARTLAKMDLTIDGLIAISETTSLGLELLKQLRDWARQTEQRLETAILTLERLRCPF